MAMIRIYASPDRCARWMQRYRDRRPHFVCVLGFTETGLLPNISAAGTTPHDRQFTAIADAEFLYAGPQPYPCYPLPPLRAGASPVLISRAVVAGQGLPLTIMNAGLRHTPPIPVLDLGGRPAGCVSRGAALPIATVQHLVQQGFNWGQQWAIAHPHTYLIVSECVVGGTTTALAVLMGLGYDAAGLVNSSHPVCNHHQKQAIASTGLQRWREQAGWNACRYPDPLAVMAAVGDPMQAVAAGLAIAVDQVSDSAGVLLAGGTQMIAVYAVAKQLMQRRYQRQLSDRILVGTTRWVAEDPTGNTPALAERVTAPLIATTLTFAAARYEPLRAYENGYVKEGVGAGGSAIAAHLYQNWNQPRLLNEVEQLAAQLDTQAVIQSRGLLS